mgnify:CR=1 FL=1
MPRRNATKKPVKRVPDKQDYREEVGCVNLSVKVIDASTGAEIKTKASYFIHGEDTLNPPPAFKSRIFDTPGTISLPQTNITCYVAIKVPEYSVYTNCRLTNLKSDANVVFVLKKCPLG